MVWRFVVFFFQAEDGIRDGHVTGVQTCALPISARASPRSVCSRERRAARRGKMGAGMARDVAVIGLGQMGRGIARNLDRAERLAAAWDASPEAMRRADLSPVVALAEPATFGSLRAVLFVVPGSAEIR